MVVSILCGGSGTRLWPISRSLLPKQFAKLIDNKSLFAKTLERNYFLKEICDKFFIQVLTSDLQYFLALDEAASLDIKIDEYILESKANNTACALIISALSVLEREDDIILALPSDHLIGDNLKEENYIDSIKQAIALAKIGKIATFGITPTSPATGYGYITSKQDKVSFYEKPDLKKAQDFLKEGGYFWNSGMFCYKASVFLQEAKKHCPSIYSSCLKLFEESKKVSKDSYLRLDPNLSQEVQALSIDYALMEKSENISLIKTSFKWNDVGSFDALSQEWEKDSFNNSSNTSLESINSSNNFILSDKLVATIGLKDHIIIDTFDALLVAKKGETQDVKKIVEKLNITNPSITKEHNKVFRPWGSYLVLKEEKNYKIKTILVKPLQRLSLQKHYHRNEHWIVVAGSAIVRIDDEEIFLKTNESTYIPMGVKHRLENKGKIDLVIIEVQVGEYLGEDDIVRFEDDYKR